MSAKWTIWMEYVPLSSISFHFYSSLCFLICQDAGFQCQKSYVSESNRHLKVKQMDDKNLKVSVCMCVTTNLEHVSANVQRCTYMTWLLKSPTLYSCSFCRFGGVLIPKTYSHVMGMTFFFTGACGTNQSNLVETLQGSVYRLQIVVDMKGTSRLL